MHVPEGEGEWERERKGAYVCAWGLYRRGWPQSVPIREIAGVSESSSCPAEELWASRDEIYLLPNEAAGRGTLGHRVRINMEQDLGGIINRRG